MCIWIVCRCAERDSENCDRQSNARPAEQAAYGGERVMKRSAWEGVDGWKTKLAAVWGLRYCNWRRWAATILSLSLAEIPAANRVVLSNPGSVSCGTCPSKPVQNPTVAGLARPVGRGQPKQRLRPLRLCPGSTVSAIVLCQGELVVPVTL